MTALDIDIGDAQGAGRIGRFVLRRELGRGAQATVWLAEDTRLQREVALKRLDPRAGSDLRERWLHEARAVSRLSHPNIVPVFEADIHDGGAYLVFEFIDGGTLAQTLRTRGALPAREAAQLMLGVLQGLAAAHRHGIVHRDLKPSNVLVGADGRARIMDFGIAALASDASDGAIAATTGYLSPEAARGDAPTPAMDVFAAGAVLAELMSGRRLVDAPAARHWLQRVQHEDLRLPDDPKIDDGLRAIAQRALARDPQQRYAGAREMHDALQAWLAPDAAIDGGATGGGGNGTLEFLLRRMRHRSDFPALSDSVQRIHRVASSDSERLSSLSDEVLKDVALTNKLLRLVNSANSAAGGGIGTVSRAVQLVGFAGIRNLALSLTLLEHMGNRAQAAQLREEFLRALMAGTLASELASTAAEREHCYLGAMFQQLGRLLTEYYLPEEAERIRQLMGRDGDALDTPRRRQTVSAQVLGIGFDELGVGVAKSWALPESLQHCMRRPEGEAPRRAVGAEARQRWLATAANAMTDALLDGHADGAESRLRTVAVRHAQALDLPVQDMLHAVQRSREHMRHAVQALGIIRPADAPSQRLVATVEVPTQPEIATGALQANVREAGTARLPASPETPDVAATLGGADRLLAGMQDITQAMAAGDFDLQQVLRMVLETIYLGLAAQRVVFCVRDARRQGLAGRFGLGVDATRLASQFHVPLLRGAPPADVFAAACLKGSEALIADARVPTIATRLPRWYRERWDAASFLLLPLVLKDVPIGLIYADCAEAGSIELDARSLSMLRALRNQALMALRQARSLEG